MFTPQKILITSFFVRRILAKEINLTLNRLCKKKVACRNFRQTTHHGALEGKTQSLQSASQKVQKLSEIQECLVKKLAKSVYFSLFNSEIEWNVRENL